MKIHNLLDENNTERKFSVTESSHFFEGTTNMNETKRRGRPKKQVQEMKQQAEQPQKSRGGQRSYADVLKKRMGGVLVILEQKILPALSQVAQTADTANLASSVRELATAWPKVSEHKSFANVHRPRTTKTPTEVKVGDVVQVIGRGFVSALHMYGEPAARGPWIVDAIHDNLIILTSKLVKGAKLSEKVKAVTDNSTTARRRHDKFARSMLEATSNNGLV